MLVDKAAKLTAPLSSPPTRSSLRITEDASLLDELGQHAKQHAQKQGGHQTAGIVVPMQRQLQLPDVVAP